MAPDGILAQRNAGLLHFCDSESGPLLRYRASLVRQADARRRWRPTGLQNLARIEQSQGIKRRFDPLHQGHGLIIDLLVQIRCLGDADAMFA